MSRRTELLLRSVLLVLATALLVAQVLAGDWVWAGLWGLVVVLVAADLARQSGSDAGGRRGSS